MSMTINSIKVLSANCQGLRTYEKIFDVLSYMKDMGAFFVCLQDTHLTENDTHSIKQIWPDVYLHGTKSNSRGVAILLNNNFEYKVNQVNKDIEGNYIQLLITCNGMTINLISLYGPNKDEPKFFDEIKQLALIEDSHYVLICGDLNLVLNPAQDCCNYVGTNNSKSRLKMVGMLQDLCLCDVYHWFHPNERKYTRTRKMPLKKSHLDYFLATTQMTDVITDCNIKSSYRSDHSIIELKICLSKFNHGKGVWKMNNTLLKNKDYLDLINKVITEEKFKYALPIYSCDCRLIQMMTFNLQ